MNSNCNNTRVVGPTGNWEYTQLLNAKVRIKSLPVSNFFCNMSSDTDLYTIDDIYFRVSLDGKVITLVALREMPGKFFTWKDLEIVEINITSRVRPICGTFRCGEALCGYKVSPDASFGLSMGSIAVVDEAGNIITNRYVRFVGADVENINTDKDNVTDINFNGDEL